MCIDIVEIWFLGLLMGRFRRIFVELSARDMIMVGYYSLTFLFQPQSTDIFLFLHENICCGYSLEVPQ